MRSKIFVINGVAGSGKDAFVQQINAILENERLRVYNLSLVSIPKEILEENTIWQGCKDEKSRLALSNILRAIEDYDNSLTSKLVNECIDCIVVSEDNALIFVHIREPKDIHMFIDKCSLMLPLVEVKTLILNRVSNPIPLPNNIGDQSVRYNMDYDITLNIKENEIYKEAQEFINKYLI